MQHVQEKIVKCFLMPLPQLSYITDLLSLSSSATRKKTRIYQFFY